MAKRAGPRSSTVEGSPQVAGEDVPVEAPAFPPETAPETPHAHPSQVEGDVAAEVAVAQTDMSPQTTEPLPAQERGSPNAEASGGANQETATEAAAAEADLGPIADGPINSQILSTVDNTDPLALGLTPAESVAMLAATMAQTLGAAMHNAVVRQQADRVVGQALISAACARILERADLLLEQPAPLAPTISKETS